MYESAKPISNFYANYFILLNLKLIQKIKIVVLTVEALIISREIVNIPKPQKDFHLQSIQVQHANQIEIEIIIAVVMIVNLLHLQLIMMIILVHLYPLMLHQKILIMMIIRVQCLLH